MAKIKYICKTCLSEDIRWDAWAKWDEDSQQMELEQSFDYTYCCNCEGECIEQEIIMEDSNEEKL